MVSGTVHSYKQAIRLGERLYSHIDAEKLNLEKVEANEVIQTLYEHPTYERHLTKILEGAVLSRREVIDYEIYEVNRRFFEGENAVRMLEKVLDIDASVSAIYKPQGYRNNHSTY